MTGDVLFSGDDGRCGAGKSSGCATLLALAEFFAELDDNKHRNFFLSLRRTQFAGEERLTLGLTCFDETTTDRLAAIPL